MTGAGARLSSKSQLAHWIARRFFARFHLTLILAFAFAVGLLTTKGFLALGLDTMHWRWPLALATAYLAFLLGIRLWLGYVGLGRYIDDTPDLDLPVGDLLDGARATGDRLPTGGSFDLPALAEAGGTLAGAAPVAILLPPWRRGRHLLQAMDCSPVLSCPTWRCRMWMRVSFPSWLWR